MTKLYLHDLLAHNIRWNWNFARAFANASCTNAPVSIVSSRFLILWAKGEMQKWTEQLTKARKLFFPGRWVCRCQSSKSGLIAPNHLRKKNEKKSQMAKKKTPFIVTYHSLVTREFWNQTYSYILSVTETQGHNPSFLSKSPLGLTCIHHLERLSN